MNKRIKLKSLLTLTCLLPFALSTFSQPTSDTLKLTVNQATNLAMISNKSIQSSQLDVQKARAKVWETTGIGLPNISLSGTYTHIFEVPTIAFGSPEPIALGVKDNTTFDLKVTQLIFSGDYIVGLQAAKVYKAISEKNLVKQQLDTRQTVSETYYLALIVDENLKIVSQNNGLTEQTLIELEAMLAQGFIEDTEVDQLKLTVNSLKNLEASLIGQSKNLQNLLKFQMGVEINQPVELTNTITELVEASSIGSINQLDINQNIDYQIMSNMVGAQKLILKREKSTFLPTIAAYYNHQELWKKSDFNFQPKDLAGLTLSLPIMVGTQRLARVKQASLAYMQSKIQQAEAAQGLQLKYDTEKLNYHIAVNDYLNKKENTEISERIFKKTTIKLKEGMASTLDLSQIQMQYLNTVSDYYSSALTLLKAKASMDRLLSLPINK